MSQACRAMTISVFGISSCDISPTSNDSPDNLCSRAIELISVTNLGLSSYPTSDMSFCRVTKWLYVAKLRYPLPQPMSATVFIDLPTHRPSSISTNLLIWRYFPCEARYTLPPSLLMPSDLRNGVSSGISRLF